MVFGKRSPSSSAKSMASSALGAGYAVLDGGHGLTLEAFSSGMGSLRFTERYEGLAMGTFLE